MSFVILQAVMKRLEERRKTRLFAEMGSTMKLPRSGPRAAVARGHRAGRPGAAADDPDPGVPRATPARRRAGAGRARAGARGGSRGGPARPAVTAAVRPRTILIAPDSFKGSLTSVEVARALAAGWTPRPAGRRRSSSARSPTAARAPSRRSRRPAAGTWQDATVDRPAGAPDPGALAAIRRRHARGGRDGEASGLSRVDRTERDPAAATTRGTGELLRAALEAGVGAIVLGIGGSATTDGGAGCCARSAPRRPRRRVDLAGPRPAASREIALRGRLRRHEPAPRTVGAAAVYGPQKGATPERGRGARRAPRAHGPTASRPRPAGASGTRRAPGAAGGVGFALLAHPGPVRVVRAPARASIW